MKIQHSHKLISYAKKLVLHLFLALYLITCIFTCNAIAGSDATFYHEYTAYTRSGAMAGYKSVGPTTNTDTSPDSVKYTPMFNLGTEDDPVIKVKHECIIYTPSGESRIPEVIGKYSYSLASFDLGSFSNSYMPNRVFQLSETGVVGSHACFYPYLATSFTASQKVRIIYKEYGTDNIVDEVILEAGEKRGVVSALHSIYIVPAKKNQTITCQNITTTYNSANFTINASVSE